MKKAADIDISTIDTQSTEFQNALKLISYTSQSVFLTGKAGTGKSTFLKYLTATTKKHYVVLAPTGIAAVNAGGVTLHSFFKLPFKPLLPDDPDFSTPRRLRERMKLSREKVKLLKKIDLIIIDEVSMVRADIIDFIDKLLRVYCGNSRQPFAGKQLLLVGDVFQLEPVITGDMRDVLSYYYKDGFFFFNAFAFRDFPIVSIELTKVYRQSDPDFIGMLDRIRIGRPTPYDVMRLNSQIDTEEDKDAEDFTMTIATRRDIVDTINDTRLNRLMMPIRKYTGTISGDFPESSLPTDKELELKEGAQVVFVKNDMSHRWVNGSIGRVSELTDKEIIVNLEDGTRHTVEREIWENIKYEYDEEKHKVNEIVIGTYEQFPLKLAWAITIHKSQGLTFDKVSIDVGKGAFSSGQTYVALSRCRSFEGIKLKSTINERDIFVNRQVVEFSQTFNDTSNIASALDYARADDCYHKSAECYDKGDYRSAVRYFSEAVCARNELHREEAMRLISLKLAKTQTLAQRVKDLEDEIAAYKQTLRKLATEYVEMGEELRADGWDLTAALANYDKAISISPDYHIAWLCKGLAFAGVSEVEAAIECFMKASKLDSEDYRPLYEGGVLAVHHGDLIQGMEMLLKALSRNDKKAEIHTALAEGYEKVGDHDNAMLHKKEAKRLKGKKKG